MAGNPATFTFRGGGMGKETDDMRRPLTTVAAAASTLCIGLAAGATESPSSPENSSPENAIDVQVPDSKARIEEYWTRDRMRAAKPTPKPLISRDAPAPATPDENPTDSE